ncbi:MAG: transglutaminase N-terminal domain-containing protein [Sedimentitalea sp.]
MSMTYDIRLTISHRYQQPAGNGRHLLRVLPRADGLRQRVTAHVLNVEPEPDQKSDRLDFFGNWTSLITHSDPHTEMSLRMACRVDVATMPPDLSASAAPQNLSAHLSDLRDLHPASPLHFLGPSPRLLADPDIAEFARACFRPTVSVAQNVVDLGAALFDAMTFDSNATTVDTNPSEAFRQRRGVCQDLSHIMILALQSLDIPAGYVSGYLRTLPPEGGVRLEGVDAMHAWVRAWCGADLGWIEYDPTNATVVGTDHIVVAYGRDYSDVGPVIGHLRSSGDQVNSQSVDVAPVS